MLLKISYSSPARQRICRNFRDDEIAFLVKVIFFLIDRDYIDRNEEGVKNKNSALDFDGKIGFR